MVLWLCFNYTKLPGKRRRKKIPLKSYLIFTKKLRNGTWPINQPVYDFYVSEIESILNSKLIEGKFPEIQKSFTDIQKQQSPYRQTLLFIDLLKRNAIPEIKEKLSLYQAKDKMLPERFLDDFENNLSSGFLYDLA